MAQPETVPFADGAQRHPDRSREHAVRRTGCRGAKVQAADCDGGQAPGAGCAGDSQSTRDGGVHCADTVVQLGGLDFGPVEGLGHDGADRTGGVDAEDGGGGGRECVQGWVGDGEEDEGECGEDAGGGEGE